MGPKSTQIVIEISIFSDLSTAGPAAALAAALAHLPRFLGLASRLATTSTTSAGTRDLGVVSVEKARRRVYATGPRGVCAGANRSRLRGARDIRMTRHLLLMPECIFTHRLAAFPCPTPSPAAPRSVTRS